MNRGPSFFTDTIPEAGIEAHEGTPISLTDTIPEAGVEAEGEDNLQI
jgi:hypothetical protein